jgi:hypothetical protein
VRLDRLGQLNTKISSGIEPATFRFVAQCLNQLRYRVPHYLLTPWPQSASELYRPSDLRLSAKLVPTSADRGCHVVSVTDPYGRILGFLDRTCCVNPIDNTHYAPITTTPSTRTKYFTRTLAQSTSLKHSHKALH